MAVHKTLHLDESPHKCNVCNRSFNQRSNLKTHLLTHTDHKPYECLTCGKVFRRNCDLRRHALTHTIGDIPSDSGDTTETNHIENNGDDDAIDGDGKDEIGEDDDMVLEVDSPVNSPIAAPRKSPTPSNQQPLVNAGNVDDDDYEPPRKEPRLDKRMDDLDSPEVTHCHHDGGQPHYTMRPSQEYYLSTKEMNIISPSSSSASASSIDYSHLRPHQSILPKIPDAYIPMLHVRRDLHQKSSIGMSPSKSTVNIHDTTPSFLESMPFRKRSAGFNREHSQETSIPYASPQQKIDPLNLSNHPPHPSHNRTLSIHQAKQLDERGLHRPLIKSDSMHCHQTEIQMPLPALVVAQAPSVLNQPAQPPRQAAPPRRTGFSIEDIMRR